MKTLRAKGALILNLAFSGVPGVIIILLGINAFCEGHIDEGIWFVFVSMLFVLVGLFAGLRIYCTHWIQYGDGKVVIRRVSKDRINGRPIGKWKNREDTFLLEEIDAYGLSWQVLGYYVEYHRSSGGSLTTEYFFQLKNGKRIGYEIVYYTRKEEKEFLRYIYEKTGIEFQK
ncbi:MAG: hypothetical protein NC393_04885 [Clostridium sp.]|nr:hypothetical protein [Clostridium sp.]MCM1171448.1 hypothetical protein [Clostridium sp.]MCM1208284.1 hypothetical protein [Ruminococcus sp.]